MNVIEGLRPLLSKWRIILFLAFLLFSIFLITFRGEALLFSFNGPQYGLEFTGGTYFQIKLEDKVAAADMERITGLISRRIDAFGLRDSKVNALGSDLVGAQIAETDPQKIAEIESLIKTQAKFEAMLDGNILFSGTDIKTISRDPAQGYGIQDAGSGFNWILPFTLSQRGAESFSHQVFHRCTAVGFDAASGTKYDCDDTYFFIDRPDDSVLVIPRAVVDADDTLFETGNPNENIPTGMSSEKLLANAGLSYIIVDSNLDSEQDGQLQTLALSKKKAIVHPSVSQEITQRLTSLGFKVQEVGSPREGLPWVWNASGARQVISITPGIANLEPYVDEISKAQIFSRLTITGGANDEQSALNELNSTAILLETGSLPIGIESVSKETISPSLGKDFLTTSFIIGIAAILSVSLLIFLRYRKLYLAIPVIFIGISEVLITVGVAILVGVRFDLASMTGVIAAVGTGLNDQIVILDELLKDGTETVEVSYANRIKKAFFIVVAAAATTTAALAPLILFSSYGFGKLAGFAATEILGILVGVLISRPAFSLIAEQILKITRPQQ